LLLFLALAYAAARDAHGATYKWVDEKGIIHYSDKMPPDAVNRAHVEFDRQGLQVKKVDPALTPDELRAKAADAERQKQEAKKQESLGVAAKYDADKQRWRMLKSKADAAVGTEATTQTVSPSVNVVPTSAMR